MLANLPWNVLDMRVSIINVYSYWSVCWNSIPHGRFCTVKGK